MKKDMPKPLPIDLFPFFFRRQLTKVISTFIQSKIAYETWYIWF